VNDLSAIVVDHNPWTRLRLTDALNDAGVQVKQASNGMTALRLALANPPHVMVLGRDDPRTLHVAIVGVRDAVDADASLALPCSPLEVLATVVDALEIRRQAVAGMPIRSVMASPRGTWPLADADSARSSSRTRNGGRSAKWRLSSGIETL
jgi:CheY-like chemotaxis protein